MTPTNDLHRHECAPHDDRPRANQPEGPQTPLDDEHRWRHLARQSRNLVALFGRAGLQQRATCLESRQAAVHGDFRSRSPSLASSASVVMNNRGRVRALRAIVSRQPPPTARKKRNSAPIATSLCVS
jgi:hypothetical protein